MKKFNSLLVYNLKDYVKSAKFFVLLIALLFLQLSVYSSKPVELIDSILMSCSYTFMIMIVVGFSYNTLEDDVSQQILILKVRSATKYYFSQIVLSLLLCLSISLFSATVPWLSDIVNDSSLFFRVFTFNDFISSFILFFFTSFCGMTLGLLIHPRLITDRKFAIIIVMFILIICFARAPLAETYPILRFVLWMVPPIAELSNYFSLSEYFSISILLNVSMQLFAYSFVYTLLRMIILLKIKF
ncbi:hypothetical protein [Tetragenococcus solitarius]|uniref:ABC transporter permease n=1 Tax=Tetragenococcus solitarius TaxID=71453 RepID=A0ABN3YCT6_9ENTE|nr:hypothetical protein [Tetragenococcus solitarius]